jgi:hypothetical protein
VPVFDCLYVTNSEYTGPLPEHDKCFGKQRGGDSKGGTYNYHIKGWAKFYVSGYVFPGSREKSYVSKALPCDTSESCLSGWFLKGQLEASAILPPGGSDDFGTYAVLPAG